TCSLRSWPTQNARPAPASTTARTAGSPATAASWSRSASLSATSREFSESGRLSVRVTTASSRETSSGSVTGGSFGGEAAVDEPVRGRPQPARVPVEEGGGRGSRPGLWQQCRRQRRVAEQERPPGVDELEQIGR